MKPRRRWMIAIGALLLVFVGLAWLCRPRAQEYRWYVSPPLVAAGHRVKVLVPVGWAFQAARSRPTSIGLGRSDRFTVFFEQETPTIVRWFRDIMRRKAAGRAYLCVDAALDPRAFGFPANPADGTVNVWPHARMGSFDAERIIRAGTPPVYAMVWVSIADRTAFATIHSTICNSLRIE